MATQLSIGEKGGTIRGQGPKLVRGRFVAWILRRCTAVSNVLGGTVKQVLGMLMSASDRGNKRKQMKLVESLPLGNRRQLMLIVCDNQKYLVGAGADSVGSILAMETGTVSRDRSVRGPELVRRRGREAAFEARSKATSNPGLDLWH